jgi:hypothetical protein
MAFIMFLESTRNCRKVQRGYHGTIRKLIWRNPGKILNLGENQAEEALYGGNNNLEPILSRNHAPQSRG